MPRPSKPAAPGYRLVRRELGDGVYEYAYGRPDGSQSEWYDRRNQAIDRTWIEYGQRKAAEESGKASK